MGWTSDLSPFSTVLRSAVAIVTAENRPGWRQLLSRILIRRAGHQSDGVLEPRRISEASAFSVTSRPKPTPPAQSSLGGSVRVSVWEGTTELWTGVAETPLEIGRMQEGDRAPLELHDHGTYHRLVIAPTSARSIPRQAMRVDCTEDCSLRITNSHSRLSFYVGPQADPLGPGETFTSSDETLVSLPENRTMRLELCDGNGQAVGKQPERLGIAAAEFERGTELGQYVIETTLGRGGMGVVYHARHRYMNRMVAVKVPPLYHRNERLLERFEQEVQVTGRLTHTNILRAYDAGTHGGQPYLVVECIDGRTVAEEVRGKGPLSIEDTLNYSIQAASGLSYAHSKGVVHRDVKPANLMIDQDRVVRLIDFGLAADVDGLLDFPPGLLDRELPEAIGRMDFQHDFLEHADATVMMMPRSVSSTHNSQLVGTPAYMSPEQTCAVDVDRRSDIYSLGCTIYCMLTAQHLFAPAEERFHRAGDVLLRHRKEPPAKISSVRGDCSALLEETLLRMLAKRPEARYSSMDDVIAALREEQSKLGFGNRVFLSYRRDDSYDATHRLYEELTAEFGKSSLVMDIDDIPAGEDFRRFVTESVRRATAVLVVIGDHWLTIQDPSGRRRLDTADDYVRLEIEIAEQCGKPIIPVLVGRVVMPPADSLPESLRFLAYRNAAEVRSGKGYHDDVKRLIARLAGILA